MNRIRQYKSVALLGSSFVFNRNFMTAVFIKKSNVCIQHVFTLCTKRQCIDTYIL